MLFGRSTLFDDAMLGDLGALFMVVKDLPAAMVGIFMFSVTCLGLYIVLSWFVVAGLIHVSIMEPEDRRSVSLTMGGGGLLNLWNIGKCAALTVVPWIAIYAFTISGVASLFKSINEEMTVWAVFRNPVDLVQVLLCLLLGLVLSTVVGFARIHIVRFPDKGVFFALMESFKLVRRSPKTLALTLLAPMGWIVFSGVYLALMTAIGQVGATSMFALFILRVFVSLGRHLCALIVLIGQVHWSNESPALSSK